MFINNNTIISEAKDNPLGKETPWEDYDTIIFGDKIIDMKKIVHDQNIARAALIKNLPWFGPYIADLRVVYTFKIATQATDGAHYFINPYFTSKLDLKDKIWVMAHELMHCVLQHMSRGASHDPTLFNIAADYEVNSTLVELGLTKKEYIDALGGLYDIKYKEWGYEKIYKSIKSNPSNQSMDNSQSGRTQSGNSGKPNSGGASGSNSGGSGTSGSGQQPQTHSEDYKKGWSQAIEDWKAGKIKL